MFAFADPGRVSGALEDAGFTDVRVEPLDFRFTYDSFDEWWRLSQALGRPLADLVEAMEPAQREDLLAKLRERFAPYATPDGGLDVPARALVAVATA
jgi:hypothetical protein